MTSLSRRHFTLSALAFGAAAFGGPAHARAATRTITTSAGTYEIPVEPKRVIAVDARLDLEPALALGLPVVGYSLREQPEPWVPVGADVPYVGKPVTRELALAYNPDLIVCTDLPGTELWPIDKLKDVAPVIPVDYEMNWKDNLTRMGAWLGREAAAADFIAGYESELADLRARHAEKIGSSKVAAVWYEPDGNQLQVLLGEGTSNVTLAGQVLADIGGATIPSSSVGEYGLVSMENAVDVFADVDAIIVDGDDDPALLAALEAAPLWDRLSAVAAGRVLVSSGIYYGGCYSARRLISEWNKVYDLV